MLVRLVVNEELGCAVWTGNFFAVSFLFLLWRWPSRCYDHTADGSTPLKLAVRHLARTPYSSDVIISDE